MTPHQIRQMYSQRNHATLGVLQFFADAHLHPELRVIVRYCRALAFEMVDRLPDGTELILGLRSLRDATDAFLRHYMVSNDFLLPVNPIAIKAPMTRANGENQI